MSKLTLADVKIIGEGPQVRKAIEKHYSSLEEFYEAHSDITNVYSTFHNYLCRDVITSDSFKCKITRILDVDYPDLFVPVEKQIREHVRNIYDNISKYKKEEDLAVFDYLLNKCKKKNMHVETAMMYRAKARNSYYTNWLNRCEEFYTYAIETLPKEEVSYQVFFYCELAYDLFREYLLEKAEKKFRCADDLVKKHKDSLDNNALHYYYYWRGIMYLDCNKNAHAREYFHQAFEYAVRNFEKASAYSNIAFSYKESEQYDKAHKYYNEALKYYDESRILTTSSIYNNMAVLYRVLGDYLNAQLYIEKALDIYKTEYDYNKLLIYTQTHVEIQMDMGDTQAYEVYLDALCSTKGKHMNKSDIIHNIKSFISNVNDKTCLNKLMRLIIELKDEANNEGYIHGLYECLGHVTEKVINLFGEV